MNTLQTFLYFAYGSNMLSRRLRERTPSALARGIGFVSRRRLTFDKVSSDGSGKCDAELTTDQRDRVEGVLFEIAMQEKSRLDDAEGPGRGYCEQTVSVATISGNVEALTYVATRKDPAILPYHWYKALAIAGAIEHTLSPMYVHRIGAVPSKLDPDPQRSIRNQALLRPGPDEPVVRCEHSARITWSDGHIRRGLPPVLVMIDPAWFADAASQHNDGWSLMCRFDAPPRDQGNPSLARVHFILDNAPHERLAPGAELSLFERATVGRARVEILE